MSSPLVTSNLPLFQAASVESQTQTTWTTLLKLKVDPDEEAYVEGIYVFISHTGDNRRLRIVSNGEPIIDYIPLEGYIFLMFMNPVLKFDGTKDKEPLVIQYRTDGTNAISVEAQIIGVRMKKPKASLTEQAATT
jgi:hypothetical protein